MKSATPLRLMATLCLISAAHGPVFPAFAQSAPVAATGAPALAYADIVDLAEASPLVANVRIRNITRLKPAAAGAAPAGRQRAFIEADVTGLIRGDGGISPSVRYLYDVPLDARGRMPKLKKTQAILFARAAERPGEIQLVAPDAQLPATPATLAQARAVVAALLAPAAPPRILGPGEAFHVAGTIAGEGESQIFLRTATGDPVSLSILRRPGEAPRWAVALGEIVDEAARPPERESLLWYRLACGLPATLPAASVRTLPVQDAEAARADYRFVIDALGPCGRTRPAA